MADGYAGKLEQVLAQILENNSDQLWQEVEAIAQNLANDMRVRDENEDLHTALGKTSLPQTLTSLLKSALDGSATPDNSRTSAIYEMLRVAANLCMDHDENRGHVLEAGFPQVTVSLLEGYQDLIPSSARPGPLPLAVPHLKVVRTAIGVLLNASLGYDPVKSRLISLEAAMTLMRLSSAIYPPGSWLTSTPREDSSEEFTEESWNLRSGLSLWAWRAISELKDDPRQVFGPDILPTLIPSLIAFIPPYPASKPPSNFDRDFTTLLLQTDFDILEESCTVLETLSLDVEDVRLSLARGLHFPAEHGGVPCLSLILDFIEKGDYSPLWYTSSYFDEVDIKRKEKSFDICKAAIVKAVVEVSGEEKNEDVLWDESEEGKPGGAFVFRMVQWLKGYTQSRGEKTDRDDLVICASLSLGNLARRENHSTALLSSYDLANLLASEKFLSVDTDVKIKHGVIGLLKHVAQSSAQSPSNRASLGNAGVIHRLTESGVWDERSDVMAEIVQISAIGVAKHLCNGSLENSLSLISSSNAPTTGLNQILALIQRSDNIAIKSEGTRVLVNVIKSLWSSNISSSESEETREKRKEAMSATLTLPSAEALARLIGRSTKYPILVNEGVVALSLLGTHTRGGPLVATALVAPLPTEAGASSASASTSSEVGSPTTRTRPVSSRRAVDVLVSILKNADLNPRSGPIPRLVNFPVEVRANVCILLGQTGKTAQGDDSNTMKEATRAALEELAKNFSEQQGREGLLASSAKKALESWEL